MLVRHWVTAAALLVSTPYPHGVVVTAARPPAPQAPPPATARAVPGTGYVPGPSPRAERAADAAHPYVLLLPPRVYAGEWLTRDHYVVAVTGDAARHRAALARRLGPLADAVRVVEHRYSLAYLLRLQRRVDAAATRLGVDVSMTAPDERRNVLDVGVASGVAGARRALRAAFPGAPIRVAHVVVTLEAR